MRRHEQPLSPLGVGHRRDDAHEQVEHDGRRREFWIGKIAGRDGLSAKANYFIGSDASQWRAGVPLFSRVSVDEVYPGVQVIYYANQSAQFEYDFLLQPGAAPEQIRFRITGADSAENLLHPAAFSAATLNVSVWPFFRPTIVCCVAVDLNW